MTKFSSLLVANRGEIALRIMRTAKQAGLRTIAVYSDADVNAPHVRFADDAVHIGASPAGDSYLRADKIIEAAKRSGAGAIHPGYGFLSENAAFAKAVEKAGLVFVGPPAKAIDVMGDKARSKRAMIKAGVPCVPGYQGDDQSDEGLVKEGKSIGFPLMVKAAAGGGGRGMRLVDDLGDLPNAISLARSEAENAFESGTLILERAIFAPRHVEFQVFADSHGNTIHLGERDCSVQRRHQKVIEEAPCPVMTPKLRQKMGAAAVKATEAVAYRGAGTVEFLLDESGEFYFLEMNTRLQVEHPVTELVTGLDLVALQLKVAAGEPLGIAQADVALHGHSMEVRLYAEDPGNGFLPSTGPVVLWHQPEGAGIRVDDGIETGGEVSPYYDPMVAKIIAHGETRSQARLRLIGALKNAALFGPKTNRDFLIDALGQDDFAEGKATTAFIAETYGEDGFASHQPTHEDLAAAAVLQFALAETEARAKTLSVNPELFQWSSTGHMESVFAYEKGDETLHLSVSPSGDGRYTVNHDDSQSDVQIRRMGANTASLVINGRGETAIFANPTGRALDLALGAHSFSVTDISAGTASIEQQSSGTVTAPMHGLLLEVAVTVGQEVARGDRLAVLEAMKMQHEIIAEVDGVVAQIAASAGAQISADDLIMEISADDNA